MHAGALGEPRPSAAALSGLDLAGRTPFRPVPEAKSSATGGADAAWRRAGGAGQGLTCWGRGLRAAGSGSPGEGAAGRRLERGGAAEGAGRGPGRGLYSLWAGPLIVSYCRVSGWLGSSVAVQRAGPGRSLMRP